MSVRVIQEAIRGSLRFCSRRSPWQQRRSMVTSVKDSSSPRQQLARRWGSMQNQKRLSLTLASAARLYSNEQNPSDQLEGSFPVSPQVEKLPFTAKVEFNENPPVGKHRSALLNLLQHCGSPSDVLDLTCGYTPSPHQVASCLNQMWTSTKKMSDEQRCHEFELMFKHRAFQKLLQNAMLCVGQMSNKDIVYSLLSMVKVGVPQQFRVVQTFLRTCQEKLNDFDLKTLSILASSLEIMDNSPNVVALKDGMRMVVEAQLPGIENVLDLRTMMRLMGKDAPEGLKLELEKKALSMSDQFSLPIAQNMISTMATMGFFSKPLLQISSNKITENIHDIPFNGLYKVLQSCKILYRDLNLLTAVSDYVAFTLDLWTNKQLILFLVAFEDLSFCPAALMEAYAEKVISNPDSLTLKDILCVLKVYSSLNYDHQHRRQQFLDSLSRVLDSYLSKMSGFEMLKAAYCWCLLGHFPPALLERLLDSSTLEKFAASKLLKSRERMFQMVDLCLRLDRPPLSRPLSVPASVLESQRPSSPSANLQLSESLKQVLEDQAHATLQEMVVEENCYVIDGVITKALPHQTPVMEARNGAGDQFCPAESSLRIAVIYAPPSGLCYGTSNPRGVLAVKIRHLKIKGYVPVLVTEQDLKSESEEERTSVLRDLIRVKYYQKCNLKSERLTS